MANVVMLTRGGGGDINPFLAVGRALAARGHRVTLMTHHLYEKTAQQGGMSFVALETREEFERMVEDSPIANSPRGTMLLFRRHLVPRIAAECEMIEEHYLPGSTVLLTRHIGEATGLIAAEKLRAPLASIIISPSDLVMTEARAKILAHAIGDDIDEVRRTLGLAPVQDWARWLDSYEQSIANWPDWFVHREPERERIARVGFLAFRGDTTAEVPDEIEEMLAGDKRPILITAGLGPFAGPKLFAAGMEACRLVGRPAILATRYKELLPTPLPEWARWFEHIPFASVLPHVEAIIHHGGIGTVGHSLAAGIPQVILAVGGDRPFNGTCLEHLGVGRRFLPPQWDAEAIAAALAQLVDSAAVRERCRGLAERVRSAKPAEAACRLIERIALVGDDLERNTSA